jgi:serine/threonine protein kinase/tetratricopeptide (TPR) repeat protein
MDDGGANQPQPEHVREGATDALTPERWQQIKNTFGLALECEPERRSALLVEVCAGDESLRADVQSLLAAAEGKGAATSEVFQSVSQPSSAQLPPGEADDPMLGRRIGAYRIERRIGYGGMASVYLASRADDEFRKRVAVKILRPDLDNAELLRRFRNERQTLAVLDHPNIVKLLDGGSTDEGLPYLVMDYVDGRPIDEYCDAHKLTVEQRVRLFCAVCEAVRCAHQSHVIHRDLKPNNILVTDDGTPKLLDFGIAKVLGAQDPSEAVVTRTATRHLTPAYASPEQVRGEPVSAATDVYSLGVVLYELLTGHRPYRLKQRTPAEMERAICEQEPESPSTAIDRVETEKLPDGTTVTKTAEGVSRTREGDPARLRRNLRGDLDNILLKALQKDRQRRYASVEDFEQDIQRHLEHRPIKARPSTLAYRASKFVRRRKTEVIASATVVFILLAAAGFSVLEQRWAAERARAELASQPSHGRRSVAVWGLKNVSGRVQSAWLSTALSEMLTTELAAGGKLRLISGEDIAQTRLNLALPETDSFNSSTLRRLYKNLGSDFVVVGSYVEAGKGEGQIRLDLRLQDAVRGDTVAAAAADGSEADLSALVARAGASLREKLGVGAPTQSEAAGTKASLPASPDAARLYAEGLEKQRLYDFLAARELLEKAAAADPKFALAHLQLSDLWASFGDGKRAQEEAKKARDLSAGLPREQSLMIEARYYEALHQWDKAIDIRRTLFKFFPDNLDHALQLVAAQSAGGKGNDSLATIESLRKLPPPDRDDPRIDLAEAQATSVVSDYRRQAVAAEQAIQKARAIGARVLVARARIIEARAYMEMGQKDKVGPALTEAQEIFKAVGDHFHEARALQQVGLAFYYQGEFGKAKEAYQQALTIQRELGSRSNEAKLLNGLGMIMNQQDDLEGAKQAYLQTLAICREIDDRAMAGTALGNLGSIEINLGDYQHAKQHLAEALDIARQVGEQSGIALQLNNLALVMIAEGDLRSAKPLYAESLQISRKTGKSNDLLIALINLGDLEVNLGELSAARSSYLEAQRVSTAAGNQLVMGASSRSLGWVQFHQGQLGEARKSYEEALAILEKIGDQRFVHDTRMALAGVDLEEGRPADAEREAQQAVEEFRKAKDADSQANAEVALVDALLAQHKIDQAESAIADATKLVAKASNRSTQIAVATAQAEVQSASGKSTEAANSLKQVVTDARRAGFVPYEFEARLALGEALNKSGNSAAARAHLLSLEKDANAKSFLLIARKAHTARTQH